MPAAPLTREDVVELVRAAESEIRALGVDVVQNQIPELRRQVSSERIEACVLYVTRGTEETEIVSLRSFIDDGGARLKQLLAQLRARGMETFRFPKVHPAESRRSGWRRSGSAPLLRIASTQ